MGVGTTVPHVISWDNLTEYSWKWILSPYPKWLVSWCWVLVPYQMGLSSGMLGLPHSMAAVSKNKHPKRVPDGSCVLFCDVVLEDTWSFLPYLISRGSRKAWFRLQGGGCRSQLLSGLGKVDRKYCDHFWKMQSVTLSWVQFSWPQQALESLPLCLLPFSALLGFGLSQRSAPA